MVSHALSGLPCAVSRGSIPGKRERLTCGAALASHPSAGGARASCSSFKGRAVPALVAKRTRRGQRSVGCSATASLLLELVADAISPVPGLFAGAVVNSLVYLLGIKVLLKGLTPWGVANSWVLGTLVFSAFGGGGYAIVCLYFLIGSAVTKLKLKQKEAEGIAEKRQGQRGAASVWGSGFAGTLCAILALFGETDWYILFRVGFVASFASKLADTASSEVGKAYGTKAYLSTTFKPVPRGTEGAVSLEGSLAGVAAAGVVALLAWGLSLADGSAAGAIVAAAVVANWAESVIGATVQGKVGWLTNDVVNVIQITLAAVLSVAFYVMIILRS